MVAGRDAGSGASRRKRLAIAAPPGAGVAVLAGAFIGFLIVILGIISSHGAGNQVARGRQGAPPVRDRVLLPCRQLGKGFLVSVGNEQRIVAETGSPARSEGNSSEALTLDRMLRPLGIDQGNRTGEVRRAVFRPCQEIGRASCRERV